MNFRFDDGNYAISNKGLYGDVRDLSLAEYTAEQRKAISLGRGSGEEYGLINDLNPKEISGDKMMVISKGRSNKNEYRGNIDDLIKQIDRWTAEQLKIVSIGRTKEHNINDLNPDIYDSKQMEILLRSRNNRGFYLNIDNLSPLKYTADDLEQRSYKYSKYIYDKTDYWDKIAQLKKEYEQKIKDFEENFWKDDCKKKLNKG